MDEQLRRIERRFYGDQLDAGEVERLRSHYMGIFGYCPEAFVIRRIRNQLDSYLLFLQNHYQTSFENLSQIIQSMPVPADAAAQDYLENYLARRQPYRLALQSSVIEQLSSAPLIRASIQLRLSLDETVPPSLRVEWENQAVTATRHISNIINSTLSQCGYTECGEVIVPELRAIGVGYPQRLIRNDSNLAEQTRGLPDAFVARYEHQYNQPLMAVKLVFPLETSQLQSTLPYNEAPGVYVEGNYDYIRPGSLRSWLEEHDLHRGFLVLIGVTTRIFRQFSTDRETANHELWQASEADILESPEVIYFYCLDRHEFFYVPAGSFYFKVCNFLRLVADIPGIL